MNDRNSANRATPEKLYTPVGRVSFPYVFEKNDYNDPPKYELTLLFPPGTDLTELKNAARAAVKAKWGDKVPKGLRSPFRDAAEKDGLDGYSPGWTFIAFRTTRRPGVVDANVQPIIDAEEFYAGCWARVTCNPYAYQRKGNCGVAFGLNNIQKMKEDESFQGGSRAEDDFAGGANDPNAYETAGEDDIFGDGQGFPPPLFDDGAGDMADDIPF